MYIVAFEIASAMILFALANDDSCLTGSLHLQYNA